MTHIHVPFHGEGSGTAQLNWAQLGIWKTMTGTGMAMNIGGVVPVEPGTTVEDLERLLRSLVGRHQALRTRLRLVPGGTPWIVVSESGEVPLELVDVPEGGDAEAA